MILRYIKYINKIRTYRRRLNLTYNNLVSLLVIILEEY